MYIKKSHFSTVKILCLHLVISSLRFYNHLASCIVGAIFEQGGGELEATKFLLIWLLYDPNGQDPKGF